MGVKFKPIPNKHLYQFGNDVQNSLGSIKMRIPINDDKIIIVDVDVVSADVPFLIGLDFLDTYGFYVNNLDDKLYCPKLGIKIPLKRKYGHIYLEWGKTDNILYTKSELLKIHRGFSHPETDKLYKLLKLARPAETNSDTRELLQEIADHCDTCQRYSSPPLRFKASMPDESELVFGDELSIDLMFLDGKAVLHIIDTATRFSAATFLDSHGETYGQSVDGIWLAFCMTWCTMYTGYPNRLRTDQGSVFTSDRWRKIAESNGIQLRLSGVKAHSSLGIGEKLHGPLRRIYNKVVASHPTLPKQFCLRIANKAMNDTIGENGLVPSRLVFGIIPRYPILNTDLPNQKERMEAIKLAQSEMNSIIAERRVLAALTKKIPPAADRQYNWAEELLILSLIHI